MALTTTHFVLALLAASQYLGVAHGKACVTVVNSTPQQLAVVRTKEDYGNDFANLKPGQNYTACGNSYDAGSADAVWDTDFLFTNQREDRLSTPELVDFAAYIMTCPCPGKCKPVTNANERLDGNLKTAQVVSVDYHSDWYSIRVHNDCGHLRLGNDLRCMDLYYESDSPKGNSRYKLDTAVSWSSDSFAKNFTVRGNNPSKGRFTADLEGNVVYEITEAPSLCYHFDYPYTPYECCASG